MVASHSRTFQLNALSELELHSVEADLVTYRDRRAVRLVEQGEPANAIAILSGSDFKDGVMKRRSQGFREKMPRRICAAS